MQPSDINPQKIVLLENKYNLYLLPNAFRNTPTHGTDCDRNPGLN
jgi:hypothetical protein